MVPVPEKMSPESVPVSAPAGLPCASVSLMSSLPSVSVPSIFDAPHMPVRFSPFAFKETLVYCGSAWVAIVAIQFPETSAAMHACVNAIAPARAIIFIHCVAIVLLLFIRVSTA
jgi:hypothetical protein